jgi:hypothetical protein
METPKDVQRRCRYKGYKTVTDPSCHPQKDATMLKGVSRGVVTFRLGSRIYILMQRRLIDDSLFERIRPWHACGLAVWSDRRDPEDAEYAA